MLEYLDSNSYNIFMFKMILLTYLSVLVFKFKLWKRSISTTIILISFAVSTVFEYYGLLYMSDIIILSAITLLVVRGTTKHDNDVLFKMPKKFNRRSTDA